jgi:hypothetical protein
MTGPRRYRKRPIEVEAIQWWANGDHPDDRIGEQVYDPFIDAYFDKLEGAVVRYFRHPDVPGHAECDCGRVMHDHGWIDTLEGGHKVCPGDWIITGVQGERYPCKPDIFAATYEEMPA